MKPFLFLAVTALAVFVVLFSGSEKIKAESSAGTEDSSLTVWIKQSKYTLSEIEKSNGAVKITAKVLDAGGNLLKPADGTEAAYAIGYKAEPSNENVINSMDFDASTNFYTADGLLPFAIPASAEAGTYYVKVRAKISSGYIYKTATFEVTDISKTIKVVSPNGGEKWNAGETYNIVWTATGISKMKIYLLWDEADGSQSSKEIKSLDYAGSSIPDDNSYQYAWTIPSSQALLTDYSIKVSDAGESAMGRTGIDYDSSDSKFSVVLIPSVKVITPNGGENWQSGKTYEIKYSTANINSVALSGNVIAMSLCAIDLYQSGADRAVKSLAESYSFKNYNWTIPGDLEEGKYKISVRCNEAGSVTAYADESDDYFTISKKVPSSSIKVLSPNGGEKWKIGETHDISWEAAGITKVKILLLWNEADGSPSSKEIAVDDLASSGTLAPSRHGWTIPATIKPRDNYRVQISNAAKSIVNQSSIDYDTSDSFLSITSADMQPIDSSAWIKEGQYAFLEKNDTKYFNGPSPATACLPSYSSYNNIKYLTNGPANTDSQHRLDLAESKTVTIPVGTTAGTIHMLASGNLGNTVNGGTADIILGIKYADDTYLELSGEINWNWAHANNKQTQYYKRIAIPGGDKCSMSTERESSLYSLSFANPAPLKNISSITISDSWDVGYPYSNVIAMTLDSNQVLSAAPIADDSNCFPDGTLIKKPGDSKVYVIKDCKKQWIESEDDFEKGGYDWDNVLESKNVINAYADYLESKAKLLRAMGDNKVYRIWNGKKILIPNENSFNAAGLDWKNIESVAASEVASYPNVKLVKAENDPRVYYITNTGFKKHILNPDVFSSYGNKWEDVVTVAADQVNALPSVKLIKGENDYRIYLIDDGAKKWIKSSNAFVKRGYKWAEVTPVNGVELNAYPVGKDIE